MTHAPRASSFLVVGKLSGSNSAQESLYAPLCSDKHQLQESLLALGYTDYWHGFTQAWFCSLSKDPKLAKRSREAATYKYSGQADLQPYAIDKALSGGRVLTIVGDSLADQQFLSLFCLLGRVVNMSSIGNRAFSLASGGRVQHVRTDFLVDARHALGLVAVDGLPLLRQTDGSYRSHQLRASREDRAWAPRLRYGQEGAADLLLLATGAHWPTHSLDVARFASLMPQVLEAVRVAGFAGQILYRTLFAPGCGTQPQNNRTAFLQPSAPYGWAMYQEIDRQAAALGLAESNASQSQTAQWRIINVSVATSQRVDGHCGECHAATPGGTRGYDCLHFCLVPGGPVDLWNAALFENITHFS